MKLLLLSTAIIVSFAIVPSLYGQVDQPENPVCGRDQAMARMPKDKQAELIESSTTFQASELMIYLHFDGMTVLGGYENAGNHTSSIISGVRTCPPATLTPAQKDEVIKLVTDDYSPFNIRVTTDEAEFTAYPEGLREMVIVTTIPQVIGFGSYVGGVSPWAGPGFRIQNSISFVFASAFGNDPIDVSHVISHESGHQLGLDHQHQFNASCGFMAEYNPGYGSGPLGFSPIMGNGFAGGVTNWFAQTCPGPTNQYFQNDYSMINDQVTVRTDDFPDSPSGSPQPNGPITGVLEHGSDVDYVRVKFRNSGPATVSSDNIDLKVSLLGGNGDVIAVYNDPDSTNVTIPAVSGTRYLKIEGESNANMSSVFMTGTYRISY